MRVLLSWLKEYVDIPYGIDDLVDRLPMLGIGVDAVERFGDDAVLDLEIPANRGDLMCVVGVARELAAAGRTSIRLPGTTDDPPAGPLEAVRVDVEEPALCPRFTARLIVDVKVGPSPDWMRRRLEVCGIRSINNIVDVTNYVMLELGQPMHAFDFDLLAGGRIVVRHARPGERLPTLDGVDRALDGQTLVVADERRPVGIGGIIGGANTEISPTTTRVLLEAASWHPPMIRRTSKRLGVRTESSARFERGIDTGAIPAASARAIHLMREVAGGRLLPGAIDAYPAPAPPRSVEVRWPGVARLLGMAVPFDDGQAILRGLGFGLTVRGDTLVAQVPSFRRDVERAEDVAEEVARHHGYEQIPETMPVEATAQASRAPVLEAERAVREILIHCGLTEALTVSLTNPAALDTLRLPAGHPWRDSVRLLNPLVEDHTQLRTTLLPGLLQVAGVNASRRVGDVQIFELGRTFHPGRGAVEERRRLGLLLMGRTIRGAWNVPAGVAAATYYHVKGVVESLLEELRIGGAAFAATQQPWLHPGRAAQLALDGAVIGTVGELHPYVAAAYDLPPGVYLADLDVETLLRKADFAPRFVPLPRFPSVRRDIAVVVADRVAAAEVLAVITESGGPQLESAELFDVYTGAPVPAGHKNLAYALSFRAADRTLTADDVEAAVHRITQALTHRLRAKIRE